MSRASPRRAAPSTRPAATPRSRDEPEGVRVAMEIAMRLHVAARGAFKLLRDMDRAGALRLPFQGHDAVMAELRRVLNVEDL